MGADLLRLARWAALVVGVLLIAIFAATFVSLAFVMQRFGGILFRWDLVLINWPWAALLAGGCLLVAGAICSSQLTKRGRSS